MKVSEGRSAQSDASGGARKTGGAMEAGRGAQTTLARRRRVRKDRANPPGQTSWSSRVPEAPPSPCRRICRLEARICQGCGRTGREIALWPSADAQEKRAILEASAARLAMREVQLDSA
ncbi:MAG: DUF1289 domain-containing protein [Roseomonas sp.]|nr:DUF1289 domain-containing protein [Roseomonas sp.]